MNYKILAALAAFVCLTSSCQKNTSNTNVISQTYVHKYGYAVSQKEWQDKNYPGQVISLLKNGVTVTATYEDGILHGPCTYSYPNSKTVEKYVLYNQNEPVKEIVYDIAGMPLQETLQETEHRHSLTTWYSDGVPKSLEQYVQDELIAGQYFTKENELESGVQDGKGVRIIRDIAGTLSCKDLIDKGLLAKRETFYANGSPESVSHYYKGILEGLRQVFSIQGEPLSVEEWAEGHLHGLCSYFKNGAKEFEVSYIQGQKNGLETHFMDGEAIVHQISWLNNEKHGPETFFLANQKKVIWNYEGKEVSQSHFNELIHLDTLISQSQE